MTHDDKVELRELLDDKLDPIVEKMNEHHETLYSERGLKYMTLRHEGILKGVIWVVATMFTAGIGIAAAAVAGLFK
jgi:hypothetical protein